MTETDERPEVTVGEWLERRLAGAPPDLAAAIRRLLEEASSGGGAVPDRLADGALHGFEGVLRAEEPSPRSRDTALRLLAADAMLTYAFEASADLETDTDELAERVGPRGTLGGLLVEARSAEGDLS